jgi:transposase-like protein
MALQELLRKAELNGDVDFLREGVRVLAQEVMEIEVAQQLGAERYERVAERTGERNGYRDRTWDTRVGSLELRVPRVRDGSYYPSLLEPRRRGERALVAVVQEAYIQGVSTRRVDDLVKALGMSGIPKARSVGCARHWIPKSSASARDHSTARTPSVGWMPRSSRCVRSIEW